MFKLHKSKDSPRRASKTSARSASWEAQIERIKLGELPIDLVVRKLPATPQAISRMEVVFGWNKLLHVSRNKPRDLKIVCCAGRRVLGREGRA